MDYRVLNGRLLDTLSVEWSLRSLPLVSFDLFGPPARRKC
jgi:hypothetical protein